MCEDRYRKSNSRSRAKGPIPLTRIVLILSLALHAPTASAGIFDGGATEWTQIANNAELVKLLQSSSTQIENQVKQIAQGAEQIENQLKIYQNMLTNTARLPDYVWARVSGDLASLQAIVGKGQAIAFSMANADEVLAQRFPDYGELKIIASDDRRRFATLYQSWSDTNRATIGASLKAAGLTSEQMTDEAATIARLQTMSETAAGQMQALQVGHEIASAEVGQIQKLRVLTAQHMTMIGTFLQSRESERDLARTRWERFFKATVPPTSGGKKMSVEW